MRLCAALRHVPAVAVSVLPTAGTTAAVPSALSLIFGLTVFSGRHGLVTALTEENGPLMHLRASLMVGFWAKKSRGTSWNFCQWIGIGDWSSSLSVWWNPTLTHATGSTSSWLSFAT